MERRKPLRSRKPLRPYSKTNSRRREYQKHMNSIAWAHIRKCILIRDAYCCRMCGEPASDVHHLTYENFGKERPEDLIALCADCHRAQT